MEMRYRHHHDNIPRIICKFVSANILKVLCAASLFMEFTEKFVNYSSDHEQSAKAGSNEDKT